MYREAVGVVVFALFALFALTICAEEMPHQLRHRLERNINKEAIHRVCKTIPAPPPPSKPPLPRLRGTPTPVKRLCSARPLAATLPYSQRDLVLLDQEVHYLTENTTTFAEARSIPIPSSWADNLGNAASLPRIVIDSRGQEMRLDSSTHPALLYKQPGTNRMVQVANVAGVGQIETTAGARSNNFVWYRFSVDGGETFTDFKQITQDGCTASNPLPGLIVGKNTISISGTSWIYELSNGDIAIPVSGWPLDSKGNPVTPRYPVTSYHVNYVLFAKWNDDCTDLSWSQSQPVSISENLSTRGLIEPAIAELKDQPGTLLMISRGSNELAPDIPGRQWKSISYDYGRTWSAPTPFCYDNGSCFYAPSSAMNLVRAPNGRLYWIGNLSNTNTNGNSPRYPLRIGEVNESSQTLIERSVINIDTYNPDRDTPYVQLVASGTFIDPATSSLVLYLQRFDPDPSVGAGPYPYNWYRIGFQ